MAAIMGAIRWGTRRTRAPTFFREWGHNMPYPPHFNLCFVIYWYHTKLSPSHITTELRSWLLLSVTRQCMNRSIQYTQNLYGAHTSNPIANKLSQKQIMILMGSNAKQPSATDYEYLTRCQG